MIFNFDEYLNIICKLSLNMRLFQVDKHIQMYKKCSYKHILVIQYFPTNSEFCHNSKTKLTRLHVKRCENNTMTGVYQVVNLYLCKLHLISTFLLLSLGRYHQPQGNEQFLATTKLATNKAICIKKINKSKMYF